MKRPNAAGPDSPVEFERKKLPRGNGDWQGYDHVYHNLQKTCETLAAGKYTYLSADHVFYMAVLGCGDEETMKYYQMVAKNRKLC